MTGTTPRRRHSPAVYRRRRLVLLLAVLAVVAVVWLLIWQPWAGSASETPEKNDQPQTQSTASALPVPADGQATADPNATGAVEGAVVEGTPTPGATPTAKACAAGDVTVEPVTSRDTYGADENPQFSIKLTNNGADCTLNVGTTLQVFTVMSGDDTWWRSTDCQSEPSDMIVLIGAGQTVTSATPLQWDRTRSAVGTCDDPTRARAPGGGASYHLSVEIGGIGGTDSQQFLLY